MPRAHPATASARKRPAYVSPSSATLAVGVNGGTPVSYGLTPATPGCVTQATVLACTFSIVVPAGLDTLALSLADAAGNVLSRNVVSATIVAGASTPVNVTLAGVPAAVAIVPGTNAYSDTSVAPYEIPGLFPIPVEVEALDADGNVIVGPGAPTLQSVTVSNTSAATIAPAVGTDPFAYVLSPTGAGGGKSVIITALVQGVTLADGTTSSPVSGTTTYSFTPAIAVGSGPFITMYSVASAQPFLSFQACPGECGAVTVDDLTADARGRIYTLIVQFEGASVTSTVFESTTGATKPALGLGSTNGVHSVGGITLDSHANLYVANGNTGSFFGGGKHLPPAITNYAFGATSPAYTIANTFEAPGGIAVDKNGDVFESDPNDTLTIAEYPPNSQTQSQTLSDPSLAGPTRMVADAAGGLYVIDAVNNDIAYFAPGQTALTTTLTDPSFGAGIGALMIDPQGNLWVAISNGSGEIERLAATSLPNAVVITETLPGGGYMGYIP